MSTNGDGIIDKYKIFLMIKVLAYILKVCTYIQTLDEFMNQNDIKLGGKLLNG